MAHMLKLRFLAYAPNKLYGGLDEKSEILYNKNK